MSTHRTCDPDHLIGNTKSGKTRNSKLIYIYILNDEIEKKSIIKNNSKEKIAIKRVRIKFERKKWDGE